MPKLLSPAFPPRRPSGYIRYALAAAVIIFLFYSFHHSSPDAPNLSHTKPGAVPAEQPFFEAQPPSPEKVDPKGGNAPAGGIGDYAPSVGQTHEDEEPLIEEEKPKSPKDPKPPAVKPPAPAADHSSSRPDSSGPESAHPIDKLIYDAQHEFAGLLSKETKTLSEAAQAYRKRRGRHPPPGFDKWVEFATNNNAVIVEDFFDQIYHDLTPFWGMDPAFIRKESDDFEMTIHIRDGVASAESDWFWTQIWLNLTKTVEHMLPDMDLALNAMDEPRLVVPWEDMRDIMKIADKSYGLPKAKDVVSDFKKLPPPGKGDADIKARDKEWEKTSPYWEIARRGCPPDSLARTTPVVDSYKNPPTIDVSHADAHSFKGFVSNYTLSTQLCHQPDLQSLEGILISPLSTSATKHLFPMFGGSKLAVNNEILLPAPMYWSEEERFTGGDDHGVPWASKYNQVIWRGVATGGRNTADNWRGFQRHRFVAMNNGTTVSNVESGSAVPENFALPDKQYSLQAQADGTLGGWINEWADVAFIDMMCEPHEDEGTCEYNSHYYQVTPGLTMSEQFDSKYVPDIDGNSFSGRYLGFLRSTSLPIKATLWREWHDSRLVAWKHFVPMDSRFGDYYGIMEYFLGYKGRNAHDKAAEKIASEGKEWADKVLRKEDMQIYVLRLLLEYGRVIDERRESMGWVDDVLADPSLEKIWKDWW
ncbi:glycosyltransferase family 90 protein [Stachybotrys elegans]|uniref:Glycosyltransferase family 90 protein n=1 Tax=Stachybotrys elegans TaxID=80388 RepID=A0A8K0WUJ9_9HYPO|nr:glycosyltransferase family 90 protein [Stachybotrys elegans]